MFRSKGGLKLKNENIYAETVFFDEIIVDNFAGGGGASTGWRCSMKS